LRFGITTAAALLAGGAIFAAAATAAPTAPAGGQIYIHATGSEGPAGKIVIVGAIGDHGKTLQMDKNGKIDPNGNFVKIKLQKGTFEVDSTALNAKENQQHPMVNKGTCSFMLTGTAPVKLFNGTGLYKGIHGTVTITIAFGGIGPDYASGPHKGQCNMNQNVAPVVQFASVSGPGTVSFS
jgi:hypothetical protein